MSERKFDEWFAQLKVEMAKGGHPYANTEDQECWRCYWEEGYSPADALAEDASYAD